MPAGVFSICPLTKRFQGHCPGKQEALHFLAGGRIHAALAVAWRRACCISTLLLVVGKGVLKRGDWKFSVLA